MVRLIYDSLGKYLINHKNYPEKIKYEFNKEFADSFSCKNIVIDYKRGNALKLRKDKSIIKCYHGSKELNKEEIKAIYDNESFPLSRIPCLWCPSKIRQKYLLPSLKFSLAGFLNS